MEKQIYFLRLFIFAGIFIDYCVCVVFEGSMMASKCLIFNVLYRLQEKLATFTATLQLRHIETH